MTKRGAAALFVVSALLAATGVVEAAGTPAATFELKKCTDSIFASCPSVIDEETEKSFTLDPKVDKYFTLKLSGLSTTAAGKYAVASVFSVVADGVDTMSMYPFDSVGLAELTAGALEFQLTLTTAVSSRLQFKVKPYTLAATEKTDADVVQTVLPALANAPTSTATGMTSGALRFAWRPVFKFAFDQQCTKFSALYNTVDSPTAVDDLTRISSTRQSLKFKRPYTTDTAYLCVEGLLGFGADAKTLPLSKLAKVRYDQLAAGSTETAAYIPLPTDAADDAGSFFSTFNSPPVRVENGVSVYALKPSDPAGVPPGEYSFFTPKDYLANRAGIRNAPSKGAEGASTIDGSFKQKFSLFVNMTVFVIPSVSLTGAVAPGSDVATTSNTLGSDGSLVAAAAIKAASGLMFSSGKLPEGSYELPVREVYTKVSRTSAPPAPIAEEEIHQQTDPAPPSATIAIKVTMPASQWVLSRLRNVAGVSAFFTEFGIYTLASSPKSVVDPADTFVDDGRIAGPGFVSLIYTTSLPARSDTLVAFTANAESAKRVLGPLYTVPLKVPVAWQPRITFWAGPSRDDAKIVKPSSRVSPSTGWIGIRLYADYGLSGEYTPANSKPSFSVFNVYGPPGPGGQPLLIAGHADATGQLTHKFQPGSDSDPGFNYDGKPSDAAAEYLEWRLAITSSTPPGKYVFQLPYNRILSGSASKNVFVNATLTLGQTAYLTSAVLDSAARAFLVRVEQPVTCTGVPSLPFEVEVQVPCTSSGSPGPQEDDRTDFYRSNVCARAKTEADSYTRELYQCNQNSNPALVDSCAVRVPAPTCTGGLYKIRGRSQMAPASGVDIVVVRIPPVVWDALQAKIKEEAANAAINAANADTDSAPIAFKIYQPKLSSLLAEKVLNTAMTLTVARLTERFGKTRLWKAITTPDLVSVSVDSAWHDYLSNRPRNVAYDGASNKVPDGRAAVPPTAMALVNSPSNSVVGIELQMQSVCANKGVMVLSQVKCNAAPVAVLRADKTDMTYSASSTERDVILDSRGTTDPDGDAISITYFLLSKPAESTVQAATQFMAKKYKYKSPSDPTGKTMLTIFNNSIVSFTPDMGGRFVVGVNVTDGCSTSTATVTIDVSCPPTSVAMVSLLGVTESYDGGTRPDSGGNGGNDVQTWSYRLSAPLSEYFQDGVSQLSYEWSIKAVRPYARSIDYAVGFWGFEPPPPGSNEYDVVPVTIGSSTKTTSGSDNVKEYDCFSLGSVSSLTTTLTFNTGSSFSSNVLGYRSKDYGVSGYGYLGEKIGQSETTGGPSAAYPKPFLRTADADPVAGSTGVRLGHRLSVSSSAALQLGSTRQLALEGLKKLDKIKLVKYDKRGAEVVVPRTIACRVPVLVSLRIYDSCSRQYANDSLWLEQPACGAPPVAIAGGSVVTVSEPVVGTDPFPAIYLDGSGSYDPDTPSDKLYYTWMPTNDAAQQVFSTTAVAVVDNGNLPTKSKTGLSGRAVKFKPKKAGIYTFGLVVSDGCPRAQQVTSMVTVNAVCRSVAATLSVTTSPTTATITTVRAGEEYSLPVKTQVAIKVVSSASGDAIASATTVVGDFGPVGVKSRSLTGVFRAVAGDDVSPDSNSLVDPTSLRVYSGTGTWTYQSELISKPEGSAATFTSAGPLFTFANGFDRAGEYVFRVTISDDNCNKDSAAIVRLVKFTVTCGVPTVVVGAVVRRLATSASTCCGPNPPPTCAQNPPVPSACTEPALPLDKTGACKQPTFYDFITGAVLPQDVPEHLVLTKTVNLWYRGFGSAATNKGFPPFALAAFGTKYGSSDIWFKDLDDNNFIKLRKDRYAVTWSPSDLGIFSTGEDIIFRPGTQIPGGSKSYNFTASIVEAGTCPTYTGTVFVNAKCNPATLATEVEATYTTGAVVKTTKIASAGDCASESNVTRISFDGFAGDFPILRVKVSGTYQRPIIKFAAGNPSSNPVTLEAASLEKNWPYSEKQSEFTYTKLLCPSPNIILSTSTATTTYTLPASSPAGFFVETKKYSTTTGLAPSQISIAVNDKFVPLSFNWSSSDGCIAGRRGFATVLPVCPDFRVKLQPLKSGEDASLWDYEKQTFSPVDLELSAKYTDSEYLSSNSRPRFAVRKIGSNVVSPALGNIENIKVSVAYANRDKPLKRLLSAAVPLFMRHKKATETKTARIHRIGLDANNDELPNNANSDVTNLQSSQLQGIRMTIDLSDPPTSTALTTPCSPVDTPTAIPFATSLLDEGIVEFETGSLSAVTYFFVKADQTGSKTMTFDTCPQANTDKSIGVLAGLARTNPLFNRPMQTPMRLRLYAVPPTGNLLDAENLIPIMSVSTATGASTCTVDGESVGIVSMTTTDLKKGLYILVATFDKSAPALEYSSRDVPKPAYSVLLQKALADLRVNVKLSGDAGPDLNIVLYNYKTDLSSTAISGIDDVLDDTDGQTKYLLSTYFGKAGTRSNLDKHIFAATAGGDYPATQTLRVLPATVGTHSYVAAVSDNCGTSYSELANITARCKPMRAEAFTLVGKYKDSSNGDVDLKSTSFDTADFFEPDSSLGTSVSISAKRGEFPDTGLVVVPYYQDTATTFADAQKRLPAGFLKGQFVSTVFNGTYQLTDGKSGVIPPYSFVNPFKSDASALYKYYMRYFRPIGEGKYSFSVSVSDGCDTAYSCRDFSLKFTCEAFSAVPAGTYGTQTVVLVEAWTVTPTNPAPAPATSSIWQTQVGPGNGYQMQYQYSDATPVVLKPGIVLQLSATVQRDPPLQPLPALPFKYKKSFAPGGEGTFVSPLPTGMLPNYALGLYAGGLGIFTENDGALDNVDFTKFSYQPLVEGTHTIIPRINDGCVERTAPAIVFQATCPYTLSTPVDRVSATTFIGVSSGNAFSSKTDTASFDFPKAFKAQSGMKTMCVPRYNQIPDGTPGHAVFTVELVSHTLGGTFNSAADLPVLTCTTKTNTPTYDARHQNYGCTSLSSAKRLTGFTVQPQKPGQFVYKATTFDGCKFVSTNFTVTGVNLAKVPTFDSSRLQQRVIDPLDPISVRPPSLTDIRSVCRNYPVIRVTADKGSSVATPVGLATGGKAWDSVTLSAESSYMVADFRNLASSKPGILPLVQFDIIKAPSSSKFATIASNSTASDRYRAIFTPDVSGTYRILATGLAAAADGKPDFSETAPASLCSVGVGVIDVYADCGTTAQCRAFFAPSTVTFDSNKCQYNFPTFMPGQSSNTNPTTAIMKREDDNNYVSYYAGNKRATAATDQFFFYPAYYGYNQGSGGLDTINQDGNGVKFGLHDLECVDVVAQVADWDLKKGDEPTGINRQIYIDPTSLKLEAYFTGSVTGGPIDGITYNQAFKLPPKRIDEYLFSMRLFDGCYSTYFAFSIKTSCTSTVGTLALTPPPISAKYLGTYYPISSFSLGSTTVTLTDPVGAPITSPTFSNNALVVSSVVNTNNDLDVFVAGSSLSIYSNYKPTQAAPTTTKAFTVALSDGCLNFAASTVNFGLECYPLPAGAITWKVESVSVDSNKFVQYDPETLVGANSNEYTYAWPSPNPVKKRWKAIRVRLAPAAGSAAETDGYKIPGAKWTIAVTNKVEPAPLGVASELPYIFSEDGMYAYLEPLQEAKYTLTGTLTGDPCNLSPPRVVTVIYNADCAEGTGKCRSLDIDACPFEPLLNVQVATVSTDAFDITAAGSLSIPVFSIDTAFVNGAYEPVTITTLGSGMMGPNGSYYGLGYGLDYPYVPVAFSGLRFNLAFDAVYDNLLSVSISDNKATVYPYFKPSDAFFFVEVVLASYEQNDITKPCVTKKVRVKINKGCASGSCFCGNLLVDPDAVVQTDTVTAGTFVPLAPSTAASVTAISAGAASATSVFTVNFKVLPADKDVSVSPPVYSGFFPAVKVSTSNFHASSKPYNPLAPNGDFADRNGAVGQNYPAARISLVSAPQSSSFFPLSSAYVTSLNNSRGPLSLTMTGTRNTTLAAFIDSNNVLTFTPDAIGQYVVLIEQDAPQAFAPGCPTTSSYVVINARLDPSDQAFYPVIALKSRVVGSCPNKYDLQLILPHPSAWPMTTIPGTTAATDGSKPTLAGTFGTVNAYVSSWNNRSSYVPVPFAFNVTAFDSTSGATFDLFDPMTAPQLTLEMTTVSVPIESTATGLTLDPLKLDVPKVQFGVVSLAQASASLSNATINGTMPSVFTGLNWNFTDPESFAPLGVTSLNARSYKGHPLVNPFTDYSSGNLALLKSAFVVLPEEAATFATRFIGVSVRARDSFGCASLPATFYVALDCPKKAPIPGYIPFYPNGCRSLSCRYFMTLSPVVKVGSGAAFNLPDATPTAPASSSNVTLRYNSATGFYDRLAIDMTVPKMMRTFDAMTGQEVLGTSPAYKAIKMRVASVVQRPAGATDSDYALRASHENLPVFASNVAVPNLPLTDLPFESNDLRQGGPGAYAYGGALPFDGYANIVLQHQTTSPDPLASGWVGAKCTNCYHSGGAPLLEFYSAVPGRYVIDVRLYFDEQTEFKDCVAVRQITVDVIPFPSVNVVNLPAPIDPTQLVKNAPVTLSGTECQEQVENRRTAGVSCKCDDVSVTLKPSGVSVWQGITDGWSQVNVDFQSGIVAKDGCTNNTRVMPGASYPFDSSINPRILALSIPPLRSKDATTLLSVTSAYNAGTKLVDFTPAKDLGAGSYKLGFIAGHRTTYVADSTVCPPITGAGMLEAKCPTLKARPKIKVGASTYPALLAAPAGSPYPADDTDAPDRYADFSGSTIDITVPLSSLTGVTINLDASSSTAMNPVDGTFRKIAEATANQLSPNSATHKATVKWEFVDEPNNPLEVGSPWVQPLDPAIRNHIVDNVRAKLVGSDLTVYKKDDADYSSAVDLLQPSGYATFEKQLSTQVNNRVTGNIVLWYYGTYKVKLTVDDGCTKSTVSVNIKVVCEPLPAAYESSLKIDFTTPLWDTVPATPGFSTTPVKPMMDSRGNQLAYIMPYRAKPFDYKLKAALLGPALNSSDPSLTCDNDSNPINKVKDFPLMTPLFYLWYAKIQSSASANYYKLVAPSGSTAVASGTVEATLFGNDVEKTRFSLAAASSAFANGAAADRNVVEYTAVAMTVCRLPFVRKFTVGMACQPLPVNVDFSFTRAGIWIPGYANPATVADQNNMDPMPRARIMLGTDIRASMDSKRYAIRSYWKLVSSPLESRFNPANVPAGCSYSQADTDSTSSGLEIDTTATAALKTGLSVVHSCTIAGGSLRQAALPILELTYAFRNLISPDEVVKARDTQIARLLADVPGNYEFEVTVTDGCGSNSTRVMMRMDCPQRLPSLPAGSPTSFVYRGSSSSQAAVNNYGATMTINPANGGKVRSGSPALWAPGSLMVNVTAEVLSSTGSLMAANIASSTSPAATFFAELSRATGMPEEFPMITLPGVSSVAASVMSANGQAYAIPSAAVGMMSDTVKAKLLPSLQGDLMPVQVEWNVVAAPDTSRFSLKQALRKADDFEGDPMRFLPVPVPLSITGGSSGYRLSRAVRETMVNVNIVTTATSMATTGRVILAHSNSPRLDFQPDVPGVYVLEAVMQDDCPANITGASNTATVDSPSAAALTRGLRVPTLSAAATVVRHVLVVKCVGNLTLEMPGGVNRTVSLSGESFQSIQILSNFPRDYENVYLADGTRPALIDPKAIAANSSGAASLIERSPLAGLHISAGSHVKGRWTVISTPRNLDPRSVQVNNAHSIYGASFLPRGVGVYLLRLDIWDVRCGPSSMKSRVVRLVVDCPADIVEARIDTVWLSHGGSGLNITDPSQLVWKQNSTLLARVVGQYRLSDADAAIKAPIKYTWMAVTSEGLQARKRKGDATALSAQQLSLAPQAPVSSGLNGGQIVAIVFGCIAFVGVALYAYKTGTDQEFRAKQIAFFSGAGERLKNLSQRAMISVKTVDNDSTGAAKGAARKSATAPKSPPTVVTEGPASALAAGGLAKLPALSALSQKIREEEEDDHLTEEEKRKLEDNNPLKNLGLQSRYGGNRATRASITGALGVGMIANPIGAGATAAGTGLDTSVSTRKPGEVTGFEPIRGTAASTAADGSQSAVYANAMNSPGASIENPLRPKRLVSLKDPVATVSGAASGGAKSSLPGLAEEAEY